MAENKINYSDLFDNDDIIRGLKELQNYVKSYNAEIISVGGNAASGLKEFSLQIKTTGNDLKEATKNMRDLAKAISTLRDNSLLLSDAEREEKQRKEELIKQQRDQQRASEALDKQRQKALQQIAKQEYAERQLIEAANKEVKSQEDLRKQTNALIALRDRLDVSTKEGLKTWDELTARIKANNQQLYENDKEIGRSQRNVGNYPFKWLSDNWIKVTAAVSGAIMAIKGIASAFSSAFTTISEFQTASNELSAITGKTGAGLKELENAAVDMSTSVDASGNKINKSATEILTAFQKVASAKPELLENAEALKEVTKNAIILSQAGGRELPLDDAVKALTQIMNQFNATADESNRYINVLAAGAKFGAAEIPYLNEAITKVGAVAASSNVNIEQLTGVIELFGEKGIAAETAGTGFKQILVKLLADTKNYTNGVFDLNKAIDNNSKLEGKATLLVEKFGREYFNLAQVLLENKDRFQQLSTQVAGTNTAFEQSQTNTKGLAFETNRLKNQWEAFILSVDKGEGIMGKMVSGVVSLASSLISAITPTNKLSDAILDEQTKVLLLLDSISKLNEKSDERVKLMNELKSAYPDLFEKFKDELNYNNKIADVVRQVNEMYGKRYDLQVKSELIGSKTETLKTYEDELAKLELQNQRLILYQQAVNDGNKELAASIKKSYNSVASYSTQIGMFTDDKAIKFYIELNNKAIESNKNTIDNLNSSINKLTDEKNKGLVTAFYEDITSSMEGASEGKLKLINQFIVEYQQQNIKAAAKTMDMIKKYSEEKKKIVNDDETQTKKQQKSADDYLKKLQEIERLRIEATYKNKEKEVELENLRYKEQLIQYKDHEDAKQYINIIHEEKINEIGRKYALKRLDDFNNIELMKAKIAGYSEKELLEIENYGIQERLKVEKEGSKEYLELLLKLNDNKKKIYNLSYNGQIENAQKNADFQKGLVIAEISSYEARAKKLLEIELQLAEDKLKIAEQYAMTEGSEGGSGLTDAEAERIKALKKAVDEAKKSLRGESAPLSDNWFADVFGVSEDDRDEFIKGLDIVKDKVGEVVNSIVADWQKASEASFKQAEDNQKASDDRLNTLEEALADEKDKAANGEANHAAMLEKRLQNEKTYNEKAKAETRKALEQKKQADRAQFAMDTVLQGQNLITASTEIMKSFSKIPYVGWALGIAAVASMWGAFIAQKATMLKNINSQKPAFAKGVVGYKGKGNDTSDDNEVLISNNESIITAKGTRNAPKTLDLINRGIISDRDILLRLNLPRIQPGGQNKREKWDCIENAIRAHIEKTSEGNKMLGKLGNVFEKEDFIIIEHSNGNTTKIIKKR